VLHLPNNRNLQNPTPPHLRPQMRKVSQRREGKGRTPRAREGHEEVRVLEADDLEGQAAQRGKDGEALRREGKVQGEKTLHEVEILREEEVRRDILEKLTEVEVGKGERGVLTEEIGNEAVRGKDEIAVEAEKGVAAENASTEIETVAAPNQAKVLREEGETTRRGTKTRALWPGDDATRVTKTVAIRRLNSIRLIGLRYFNRWKATQ
jgi:hypothetical protein